MCGGRIEGATHGSINSPGYPGNYPPERDCEWTVVAPLGKRVQVQQVYPNVFEPNPKIHQLKSY